MSSAVLCNDVRFCTFSHFSDSRMVTVNWFRPVKHSPLPPVRGLRHHDGAGSVPSEGTFVQGRTWHASPDWRHDMAAHASRPCAVDQWLQDSINTLVTVMVSRCTSVEVNQTISNLHVIDYSQSNFWNDVSIWCRLCWSKRSEWESGFQPCQGQNGAKWK